MSFCCVGADKKAFEVGRQVVLQDGIVVTGATTGAPYLAAQGAKDAGGMSIGISPAASYVAHVKSYKLPVDAYDFIIYTGFDYSGRNLILTKAADAVIIVCGGFGTLNEFTIALEDDKPIGVLTGSCGVSDEIYGLLQKVNDPHHHGAGKLVFSDNPEELVRKLKLIVDNERKNVKVGPLVGE